MPLASAGFSLLRPRICMAYESVDPRLTARPATVSLASRPRWPGPWRPPPCSVLACWARATPGSTAVVAAMALQMRTCRLNCPMHPPWIRAAMARTSTPGFRRIVGTDQKWCPPGPLKRWTRCGSPDAIITTWCGPEALVRPCGPGGGSERGTSGITASRWTGGESLDQPSTAGRRWLDVGGRVDDPVALTAADIQGDRP